MRPSQVQFRLSIPLLQSNVRLGDLDALRAWYEAVGDALRSELQFDLFALWLFGPTGEPVLIEPQRLAEDHLVVPAAVPYVESAILEEIERRVQQARYLSVLCWPIRHGATDVGLILLASFAAGVYSERANQLLDIAIGAMAPILARVTRVGVPAETFDEPPPPDGSVELAQGAQAESPPTPEFAAEAILFGNLANALAGASTPRDLMLALSYALQPLLPHDAFDLLVPDETGEAFYRLALHGHGQLWADPHLVIQDFRPSVVFREWSTVLVEDALALGPDAVPRLVTVRGPEEPPRSLVATRLQLVERTVGYLLLGSAGPGLYREEDLNLLDRVGAILAARVEGFVLGGQYETLWGQFDVLRQVPMHLSRVASQLALTPLLGEGTQVLLQQARAVLPLTALEFAVRLSDESRVAVVKPGAVTPLIDLPQEPIEGTGVAAVIRGELPYLVASHEDPTGPLGVLVVPLRVGGRLFGAMAMTAPGYAPFTQTDMTVAQQLADLVAPHLDLARRVASPPPFPPGWKRASYRREVGGER